MHQKPPVLSIATHATSRRVDDFTVVTFHIPDDPCRMAVHKPHYYPMPRYAHPEAEREIWFCDTATRRPVSVQPSAYRVQQYLDGRRIYAPIPYGWIEVLVWPEDEHAEVWLTEMSQCYPSAVVCLGEYDSRDEARAELARAVAANPARRKRSGELFDERMRSYAKK